MIPKLWVKETKPISIEGGYVIDGFPSVGFTSAIASESLMYGNKYDLVGFVDSADFPTVSILKDGIPNYATRIYVNSDIKVGVFSSFLTVNEPYPRAIAKMMLLWAKKHKCSLIVSSSPMKLVEDDNRQVIAAGSTKDARDKINRLEWTVLRRLDGLLQGDYRTLFRGFGLDLADLREYQLHDDVRYIDWNVTARLAVPHVREFQEDREVAAWFLLDLSASIDFGSSGVRKRVLSAELFAVRARLFTRYGNRIGAVLQSEGASEVIPARNGRRHVLHVLDRIGVVGAPPAPGKAGAPGKVTDLAELLAFAQPVMKRRSVAAQPSA